MRPVDNNIEQTVEKLDFKAGVELHDRILTDVLEAHNESKKTKAASGQPNMWRMIMKNRITRLATAAVILVGVTGTLWYYTGSLDLASTALAEALENMQNVPWVRVRMFKANEDGEEADEFLIGLASQVGLTKRRTGEIEYLDLAGRTQFKYHPISKVAIVSYLYGHIEPPDTNFFLFTSVDEVKKRSEEGTKVEMTRREHNGKMVQVFSSVSDKHGMIVQEYIVDPQTHLPIQGTWGGGGAYFVLNEVLEFEYPDDGPRSICDVELPASINIPRDLLELVQGYHTYKKNVTDKYIAVVTTSSSESNEGEFESVRIILRDGHLMRTQYREAKDYDAWQDYLSGKRLTFDSLYTWWSNDENSQTTDVYLYDGKHDYYVSVSEMSGNYQIAGRDPNHAGLDEMGWPDIGMQFGPGRETRIIETTYSRENGLVRIDVLTPGKVDATGKRVTLPQRVLCYLDPARDYICQRMETESVLGASWHQDQTWLDAVDANDIPPNSTVISEVVECAQTDTGQWYPKIIRSVVREDEQETEESILTIYVRSNPEFPKGVFDRKVWP